MQHPKENEISIFGIIHPSWLLSVLQNKLWHSEKHLQSVPTRYATPIFKSDFQSIVGQHVVNGLTHGLFSSSLTYSSDYFWKIRL